MRKRKKEKAGQRCESQVYLRRSRHFFLVGFWAALLLLISSARKREERRAEKREERREAGGYRRPQIDPKFLMLNAHRPVTPIPAIPKRRLRAHDRNFRGSIFCVWNFLFPVLFLWDFLFFFGFAFFFGPLSFFFFFFFGG